MTLVIPQDPMRNLASATHALALEAISIDSIASSFKNMLPSIFGGVKQAKTFAADAIDPQKIKFTKEQKKFLKLTQELKFTAIADMRAYTPTGFHGLYAEYVDVLAQATGYTRNIQKNVMEPYLQFLAQCVSDRRMAVATERGNLKAADLEKNREGYHKAIGAFFIANDRGVSKISEVLQNHGDWEKIFRGLELTGQNLQAVNHKDLLAQLDQAEDYLKLLKEGLNRKDDDTIALSRETSERIAQETFQVASEMEMFSILNYRYTAVDGTITRTMDQILDAMS